MLFISNDKVDEIFDKLLKEEFKLSDYTHVNGSNLGTGKVNYGYISNFIKGVTPDKRDLLYKNAEFCIRVTDINECNDIFMQVINHIILEVPRANELNSIQEQYKRYSQQNRESKQLQREFYGKINSFENDFNNMKNEFISFENKLGNIQNEFIGILSIFSAIIIAFFGGIQVLGQVISSIKGANFYLLTMVTIVVGLILFNIIYMLLYTVSKIISKNIGISISKCKKCKNKNRFKCLISKYPVVFWYNLFSMNIFIITFILYNLDKYLVLKYMFNSFIWMFSQKKYVNLIIIFIILILSIKLLFLKFKPILSNFNKFLCLSPDECDQQEQNTPGVTQTDNVQDEVAITANNT